MDVTNADDNPSNSNWPGAHFNPINPSETMHIDQEPHTPDHTTHAQTDTATNPVYLNATTPYHFGMSPVSNASAAEDAEFTRKSIYEEAAREHMDGCRTPTFREAAAAAASMDEDFEEYGTNYNTDIGSARTPGLLDAMDDDDADDYASLTLANTRANAGFGDEYGGIGGTRTPGIRDENYTTFPAHPGAVDEDLHRSVPEPFFEDGRGASIMPGESSQGLRGSVERDLPFASGALGDSHTGYGAGFADDHASLDDASIMADMDSVAASPAHLRYNNGAFLSEANTGDSTAGASVNDQFKLPSTPASTYNKATPAGGRRNTSARHTDRSEVAHDDEDDTMGDDSPSTRPGARAKGKARADASSSTPGKRGGRTSATTTPRTPAADSTPGASGGQPRKTRMRRPAKNGIVTLKPIPRSYADCDEADKALIDMRDAGEPWSTIKSRYCALTNSQYGHSTLPNRYERLKANFVSIRAEDNILILDAKREIEDEFNAGKWERIADKVREKGGGRYEGSGLQRRFKKLMVQQGFDVREGMERGDVDFVGGESEGEGEGGE